MILRALSNFEALYLSRSSNRLNESVAQAFANGARSPPGMNEGINISRTVANELDSARFDPLLIKAVSKHAVSSLEMMLSRADGLVCFFTRLLCFMVDRDGIFIGRERSIWGYYDWTDCYSRSNAQWPGCDVFVSLLVTARKAGERTFRKRIRFRETKHQSALSSLDQV